MEKDYEFTIIMPNYNNGKYIAEAIESVIYQQANFNYQLLIADDYSEDDSPAIIRNYCDKYPDKVKAIFASENGRLLKNMLRAAKQTKTKYFCVLDSDDYYTDMGVLQRAYDFLEVHEDYAIYMENITCLFNDGSTRPYIAIQDKERTSTLEDLFRGSAVLAPTNGSFFRNLVFSQCVPQIMLDAIGTVSESSFRGDTFRTVMHLKYGKAFFKNIVCSVYRISGKGIWTRLSTFDQLLLNTQMWYDFNRFYEMKYNAEFSTLLNRNLTELLKQLGIDVGKMEYHDPTKLDQVLKLYYFVAANKDTLKKYNEKIVSELSKSEDAGNADSLPECEGETTSISTVIVNFSDGTDIKSAVLSLCYRIMVKLSILAMRVLRKLNSMMGGTVSMNITRQDIPRCR